MCAEVCPVCLGENPRIEGQDGSFWSCGLCENKGTITVVELWKAYQRMQSYYAKKVLKYMEESPIFQAKLLTEYELLDELAHTPINHETLADVARLLKESKCHCIK